MPAGRRGWQIVEEFADQGVEGRGRTIRIESPGQCWACCSSKSIENCNCLGMPVLLAVATLDGTRKEHMEFLVTVPLLILDDLDMRKLAMPSR